MNTRKGKKGFQIESQEVDSMSTNAVAYIDVGEGPAIILEEDVIADSMTTTTDFLSPP